MTETQRLSLAAGVIVGLFTTVMGLAEAAGLNGLVSATFTLLPFYIAIFALVVNRSNRFLLLGIGGALGTVFWLITTYSGFVESIRSLAFSVGGSGALALALCWSPFFLLSPLFHYRSEGPKWLHNFGSLFLCAAFVVLIIGNLVIADEPRSGKKMELLLLYKSIEAGLMLFAVFFSNRTISASYEKGIRSALFVIALVGAAYVVTLIFAPSVSSQMLVALVAVSVLVGGCFLCLLAAYYATKLNNSGSQRGKEGIVRGGTIER